MPSLWWLSSLSLVMWCIARWLFIASCWGHHLYDPLTIAMLAMLISLSICDWFIIASHHLSLTACNWCSWHLVINTDTKLQPCVTDACQLNLLLLEADVHQLSIKLMGLLVAALFLQCFLGLGSLSTFHHCCADFLVCTDEYWHLDLILQGSASCRYPFLQGPPICWRSSWCGWSISLISPSSAMIPLAPSALFWCLRVVTDFYRIMLRIRSISMMVVLGANTVF